MSDFNANFWLAASAAGPVLAVAQAVTFDRILKFKEPAFDQDKVPGLKDVPVALWLIPSLLWAATRLLVLAFTPLLGLFADLIVTTQGLDSLRRGVDALQEQRAIVLIVFSFLVLIAQPLVDLLMTDTTTYTLARWLVRCWQLVARKPTAASAASSGSSGRPDQRDQTTERQLTAAQPDATSPGRIAQLSLDDSRGLGSWLRQP